MVDREDILSFFKERSRKPLKFSEIADLMNLNPSDARSMKKMLRRLVRHGELVRTKKGLYGLAEEMELITGSFEAYGDGYGFVVQERPGQRDLFIPLRSTLSAMDGDRVVAKVEDPWRWQGRIVRVLERARRTIVGTVDLVHNVSYVKPKNKRIPFEVYVSPKCRKGAKDGQKVVVELSDYPVGLRPATGCVIKILSPAESPKEEVESIIEEFGLPKRFPRNVLTDTKELTKKLFGRRTNLTDLHTVTIDGERARDFDDAISISLGEHGYRLWVHIADVGFYVGWGCHLDLEARKRGTSVYFPDRVIPMLPKELSENLCSLRPGVERPAFTVQMDFDRYGRRLNAAFFPSLIKSNERMTYTSVRKILVDEDQKERNRYDYLLHEFDLMGELAGILRNKRLERGSLDFDLPEPEVLLDIQGIPEAIIKAERNFAHIIIEEFMIAANEAVAEYLYSKGVPSLYRIHEEPDARKVEDVIRFVKPGGKRKSAYPKNLYQILKDVKGTAIEEAANYLVLRALKQARYSVDNVGHFGLASKCYTHFTSPIRRYPDLVVHRVLREIITNKRLSEKKSEELKSMLPDVAFSSSRTERDAESAEREVVDAMRMWFMRDKVGEDFAGTVVGVSPSGVRVRLVDYYVEGFIHVSHLTDDFYLFSDKTMMLMGKNSGRSFKLGQALSVRLDRVDLDEREIVFGIVPS